MISTLTRYQNNTDNMNTSTEQASNDMDTVVGSFASALQTITDLSKDVKSQLAAPGAHVVNVMRSFYQQVSSVQQKLNQSTSSSQAHFEATVAAMDPSTRIAPIADMGDMGLADILVPTNPIAVESIPSGISSPEDNDDDKTEASVEYESDVERDHDHSKTPGASSPAAVDTTVDDTTNVSVETVTQIQEAVTNNNSDDNGEDQFVDTTTTPKTTANEADGSNNNNNEDEQGKASAIYTTSKATANADGNNNIIDHDEQGKADAINMTTPTKTTHASGTPTPNNKKSGSGSIPSKKDTNNANNTTNTTNNNKIDKGKGKAKARARTPSPDLSLTFSPITVKKIDTVRGNRMGGRLPLIKPVAALKYARATGTPFTVSGPSRLPMSEVLEETEEDTSVDKTQDETSVYHSLLDSPSRALSVTPDASSTPGPAVVRAAAAARAALAAVAAGGSPTPTRGGGGEGEQEVVGAGAAGGAGAGQGEQDVHVDVDVSSIQDDTATATFATAIGGSEGGSEYIPEDDLTIDDIIEMWDADEDNNTEAAVKSVEENKNKEKGDEDKPSDDDTATKANTAKASGSGSIPSKKDLKGKGKEVARSRSSSPGSPSPKNEKNKVVKSSKSKTAESSIKKATKSLDKNKENQPFTRRSVSPPVAGPSKTKTSVTSNNDVTTNDNKKPSNIEEMVAKELGTDAATLEKKNGKGKTKDTPTTAATTSATTISVDVEMAGVNKDITAEASGSNSGTTTTTKTSSKTGKSGAGSIASKKDLKGKGKAIFPAPSLPPPSAGPSSSFAAGPATAGPSSTTTAADPYAGPYSPAPLAPDVSAGPATAAASSSSPAGPVTAGPSTAPAAATPTPTPSPSSPKTNQGNKITKPKNKKKKRPAGRRSRESETIKRSEVKRYHHWAFKLEAQYAPCLAYAPESGSDSEADEASDEAAAQAQAEMEAQAKAQAQVEDAKDKYFVLCCAAPNCPSPNFGGKHPFRRGRALAHFAAPPKEDDDGDMRMNPCLMEIAEAEGVELEVDEDGDVEMTEAEIFERFAARVVPNQARWKVDDDWAERHNKALCEREMDEEERERMLGEVKG